MISSMSKCNFLESSLRIKNSVILKLSNFLSTFVYKIIILLMHSDNKKNTYSYQAKSSNYVQEVELLDNKILKIKITGKADFESYIKGLSLLDEIVKREKNDIFLFHDYKDLKEIPPKIRIHYKDWIFKNIDRFNLVFFASLDITSQAIIISGKVLSNKFNKVYIVKNFNEALWKINFDKLTIGRTEDKDDLSVLLRKISVIAKDSWNGDIDNGRLKYETYLIDDNIILRKLKGFFSQGDMAILVNTLENIIEDQLSKEKKYFFFLDLKDLKMASLTSRKEATKWFEEIMPNVENVAFFNLNPMLNLVVKYSMSLSGSFNKKVFVKENLTEAIRFALTYKGIIPKKKELTFKDSFFQLFKSKYKIKIINLHKEINELKLHQQERLLQLFNLLGTISWREVKDVEYTKIPDNDPFVEVFAAIKLLQYDFNNIIKDRDKLIEKAQQSEMLTSVFLANMSHEIRTPLNGIIGFSEIIAETKLDKSQKKYIDIVQQNGETLLNIINDIIDISKFEANKISIVENSFNLHNLLYGVYETFNKLIKNKDVELKLFLPTDNDELIISDEHRIKQVLTNLLSNSNKFTNKGEISFGYDIVEEHDVKFIKFFVKDTGIGISEDSKKRIFERFTQLDSKASRKYGGSGLGLSISKNIVDLFSGKIWLKSTLNKGTTFYFTIPYKMAATTNKQVLNYNTINLDNKAILIIEDDQNNYIYLKELLSAKNNNIKRAISGVEALELISENNFDVIFLDINMPGMNGWEIFSKIREIKPNAKIIAQTANAFKEDIEKAEKLGFNGYLTKPFNRKRLFEEINKVFK